MPCDQTCGLKLGEHTVHSGQTDIIAGIAQGTVDVLSTHMLMPGVGRFQNLQNFDPRQGYFQTNLA